MLMPSAIIYARFSTTEQSKGYSLERQQMLGTAFAVDHGWSVEKTITDEGRSAFHGANRLEGSALHQFELEARNGLHRGKVLVVENIDRLSRQGAKAAAQLIWGLNEHGVDVATYHDGTIYMASSSGDLLDVFKLIMGAQQSHLESANKSKRTRDTWANRFKKMSEGTQKKPVPHTPHWIDKFEGGMKLNPQRTALLNEIYDLYIDGVGIHRIVTLLNNRSEPRWSTEKSERTKNGWFYSYIYRLLTKRTVLGEYVTMDGKTVAPDFYPQAITAEKWNRAQAALGMRKGNQKTSKANFNRNLLQGIVVCEQCGGGAHFRHTTDTPQIYIDRMGLPRSYARKTYRRLLCDRARRKHECDNKTVLNYDVVEATVLNEMLPRLVEKRSETDLVIKLHERIAEQIRAREADQARLANLIDILADGGSKAILARVNALEAQIEQQTASIECATKELAIETSKPSSDDDVLAIESLRAELTSDDDAIRTYARGRVNMTLRRLIGRIAITNVDTFKIEPDELSSWHFDHEGGMLEGQYIP